MLTLTPDEVMREAHRELNGALADDLMQRIRSGTPAFFESLVVRLFVAMGYGGPVANVSKALLGGTGDGGVDGIIDQDALGLDRIYVQAKRYADGNTVGASAIRDFFGSLDRFKATRGLFVTASTRPFFKLVMRPGAEPRLQATIPARALALVKMPSVEI
jgi:restriction system protein